ncbi:MAG: NUDIX domain-containing protein [Parcubacteria group bacterium]|nr:NUDIX domain-containing protein [Parcubacteria group bacterium]
MKKRIKIFKAKPGQVDYTNIRWAPVINCVVRYKGKILIVQRSKELHFYPGYWNGISGFLDDKKSLEEKVRVELQEETGIKKKDILSIRLGEIFHTNAPKYKKTWIVHPVLVDVKTDKVRLDWEGQDHKWIDPKELTTLKILSDFNNVLKKLSGVWKEK